MFSCITGGDVISCIDNISSHLLVIVNLSVNINRSESSFCHVDTPKGIDWNKVNSEHISHYQCKVDKLLDNIIIQMMLCPVRIICVHVNRILIILSICVKN